MTTFHFCNRDCYYNIIVDIWSNDSNSIRNRFWAGQR